MAELANCSRCNTVFVKSTRTVCQECFKEEEKAFQIVYTFLREHKNREATIIEIVEETGVEEGLIIKFMKEKRLRLTDHPNLGYPCEKCGIPITTDRLCSNCSEGLIRDIKMQDEIDAITKDQENTPTYYTLDNK